MVNNKDLLMPPVGFHKELNMFLHCQLVVRKKDHPNENIKDKVVGVYFIKSRDHFERIMPEIILLCEHYRARAYLNITEKSIELLQKEVLLELAQDNKLGNTRDPNKVVNSSAGKLKGTEPKWIIDVDEDTDKLLLYQALNEVFKHYHGINEWLYKKVPTVHGYHLITKPFNLNVFSTITKGTIDVHKNSMGTLLYYPKSLE